METGSKLKRRLIQGFIAMAILAAIAVSKASVTSVSEAEGMTRIQELEKELNAIKTQNAKDEELGQYVLSQMLLVRSRLSPLAKQSVAQTVVHVVNDIFETDEHKKAFIAVLAIESRFERFAQSPTGPKGMSQVAKSAFQEGLSACSSLKFDDNDVWDTGINVLAGACYFRTILNGAAKGDVFTAIVAYNQGINSDSFKSYKSTGDIKNEEALKYVAKFVYLTKKKEEVTEKK